MERETVKKDLQKLEASSSSSMEKQEEKTNKLKDEMVDRLSNLPDEVLHHIVSFLDTKAAVRTSVLSKRWRYIWIGLAILHFRLNSFDNPISFKNFVKHVLMHRDMSKSIFKLVCYFDLHCFNRSMFSKVINYLVSYGHSVQNLIIGQCNLEMLPPLLPQVFAWSSLRALKLDRMKIPNNTQFNLVSLTTLHLIKCFIAWDQGSTYDPFRGCLRLENLLLVSCVWFNAKTFNEAKKIVISAPELKHLKLFHYNFYDNSFSEHKIALSSPKLRSFSFEGLRMFDGSITSLPDLEKVNVDIWPDIPALANSSENQQRLINVFRAIGHAKFVTLSLDTINVLSKIPDVQAGHFSPFEGVKMLKIRVKPCCLSSSSTSMITLAFCVITYLLSASPSADQAIVMEYVDNQKPDLSLGESDCHLN